MLLYFLYGFGDIKAHGWQFTLKEKNGLIVMQTAYGWQISFKVISHCYVRNMRSATYSPPELSFFKSIIIL